MKIQVRKFILISLLAFIYCTVANAQINIGAGIDVHVSNDFYKVNQYYGGYSFNTYLSYRLDKIEPGIELFENTLYKSAYNEYQNLHYQLFLKYYPLKSDIYVMGAAFYSNENRQQRYKVNSSDNYEYLNDNGSWLGYGVSLGYQDRLIKNTNIYFNTELSFNDYAILLTDNYYSDNRIGLAFLGIKLRFIYKIGINHHNKNS